MQALLINLLNNSGIKPLRPALPVPRPERDREVRLARYRAFRLQSLGGPDHKTTLKKSGLGQG